MKVAVPFNGIISVQNRDLLARATTSRNLHKSIIFFFSSFRRVFILFFLRVTVKYKTESNIKLNEGATERDKKRNLINTFHLHVT